MKFASLTALVAVAAAQDTAGIDCTGLAVTTQAAYGSTCVGDAQNGNGMHTWPVGVPATYCHGWEASDNGGNKQRYSANALKCSEDSTIFYYTLYHGVIDCGAAAKANKVEDRNFTMTCEKKQDNMYGQALDLSCCDTRGTGFQKCVKASPSVQWGNQLVNPKVYANGQVCLNASNTTSAATTTKKVTTTVAPTTAAPTLAPTVAPATTAKSTAASAALGTVALVAAALAL
ncbi:Aste57867_12052 [Aphanomyces stellatus]|uniref:Aste57867_12052 protein n=1 Tax=Aphanomyces stellatus TaxID=120398 RepID=A0A485KV05_9STRA|nr:hypothetical protein As57867_012007 [Aphanomyces stellatus]VFT88907.1 Aste57867_12052 [Aphanomyces stellatus]